MLEKFSVSLFAAACVVLSACDAVKVPGPRGLPAPEPSVTAPPAYVLTHTEIRDITSGPLGRTYQLFVSLPHSYHDDLAHRFPVMFVTDASYAFPLVRNIARMVGDGGKGLEDFVLIGLSYAVGDTPQYSRRRDYTPTPNSEDTVSDMPGRAALHGEAEAYRRFIADEVFPFVAEHYRVDMQRKIFAGHSYGGLFGAHIVLTEPTMFERYILSSPSLWYDNKVILERERAYAAAHTDMRANVFLAIGAFETVKPSSQNRRYHRNNDMVRDLKTFEARLRSRRYPNLRIESTVIADEDHLTVYPAAITRGLMWALPVE
jgi:predicted alpha/beta superfamily hydrolase